MRDMKQAIDILALEKDIKGRGGWGSTQSVGADGVCPDGSGGGAAYGAYACSMGSMLVASGRLTTDFFTKLPPGQAGLRNFMIYQHPDKDWYLFGYLENPSAEDKKAYSTLAASWAWAVTIQADYGMQMAVKLSM